MTDQQLIARAAERGVIKCPTAFAQGCEIRSSTRKIIRTQARKERQMKHR